MHTIDQDVGKSILAVIWIVKLTSSSTYAMVSTWWSMPLPAIAVVCVPN
jgi:hypothetical protein